MIRIFGVTLFFLSILFSRSLGQDIVNTKHYAVEEGLDNRIVHSICRSKSGLFHILGPNGIQSFDGRSMDQEITRYPESFVPLDASISCGDDDFAILFSKGGHKVFKYYFSSQLIEPLLFPDLKKAKMIDNVLYYLTFEGKIYQNRGSDSASLIYDGSSEIADFWINENDLYLVNANGNLVRESSGKSHDLYDNAYSIVGIINDDLWVQSDIGILMFESHALSYSERIGEYTRAVIRSDIYGNVLLGLSADAQRLREFYFYPSDGGPRQDRSHLLDFNDTVIDFFSEDFTKHVLLCTYNGLIHHRISELIKPFHKDKNKREGTFGNLVSNIFYRDLDSSIYIMREVTGLMKMEGEALVDIHSEQQQMLVDGRKYTHYDKDRDKLFMSSSVTDFYSLHTYDFANSTMASREIDVMVNSVKPIGPDKLLFAGFDKSENSADNGAILIFNKESGEIEFRQTFLVPTIFDVLIHSGDLYLGTISGLYVIKGFDQYENPRDLRLSPVEETSDNYFYIDTLHNGQLVASRAGQGLVFIEDYRVVKRLSVEDGLCDNSIASIKYDTKNQVYWMGTFNGIAVMDTACEVLNTFLYKDGMPASETNRFACTEDNNGNYYFGTINGFARFDPSKLLKDDHLEKYYPEYISYKSSNAEYRIQLGLDNQRMIPNGVDDVDIYYQTRDYLTDERYQRWKYFDISSDVSTDRFEVSHGKISANFPQSGIRNLKIFKRSDPSKVFMTMQIGKQSFLGQYYPFALLALLIAGLLWMLLSISNKRAIANEALKASEANRELAVAHLQSLRSQMNPHFIFNALGSIQYYIETNESEIATEYLSDFAMLMRLILESSKNEMISFKNEIKQLKLYVRLEHMRFEGKFDFKFEIDEEIDQDYQMPPMLVQPFVENAINHGLYHLTNIKGDLQIRIKYVSEDEIRFSVIDNGIGREASKKLRRSQHISRGLEIVQERIKALEHLSIFVSVQVIDLTDEGKALGTEVHISFKYIE